MQNRNVKPQEHLGKVKRRKNNELKRLHSSMNELKEEILEHERYIEQLELSLKEREDKIAAQQKYTEQLEGDLEEAIGERIFFQSRYNYVRSSVIDRYGEERCIVYDDESGKTCNAVLKPLLSDALQTVSMREKVEHLKNENEALKKLRKSAEQETLHMQRHAETLHTEVGTLNEQLDESEQQLESLRQHIKHTQTQLETLQTDMLGRVDQIRAVPDDHFEREFRALAALIKTLSRSVELTPDTDITGILGECVLTMVVSENMWQTRLRKKYYIEAWIWSFLMRTAFSRPLAFAAKASISIDGDWQLLFGKDHIAKWPSPSSVSEKCRYMIAERLLELSEQHVPMQGGVSSTSTSGPGSASIEIQQGILDARAGHIKVLSEKLKLLSTTVDFSHVPNIITKAFSLAAQMARQRCRVQVTYPNIDAGFIKTQMVVLTDDEDEDDLMEGSVAFTVAPGLTKWGDANGDRLDQRYDIVPAVVQLKPIIPVQTEPSCNEQVEFRPS